MKAQSGLETFVAVSIIIVIVILSLITYLTKSPEVEFTKGYLAAQKICYDVKNIINQVSADGFGSAVKFSVPNNLENLDFNLTVNSTTKIITIEWDKNLYSCTMLTQNVTNSTHLLFQLKKGEVVAKNIDGVVVIE